MKSMLIIASLIAVAVAGPAHRGLVAPGMPGPAPVIDEISVGPAIIDSFEPVPVGPVIDVPGPNGTPLVQIILNINTAAVEVISPAPVETPVVPEVVIPGPVNVVDNVVISPEPVVIGTPELPEVVVPGPVNVVDNVVISPEPVVIGTPELPQPVVIPAPVVIGTPALPEVVPEPVVIGTPTIVEPIVVGTPVIPAPVVVLPEILN